MPLEPQPGQLIGSNIRLESALDQGGMGKVWIAEHLTLHAKVVVKFMAEELASTPEGRSRFSREAAAAARVRSPHVVQTLDHGVTTDGIPYIVLELLEGHDLGRHIEANGRMPPGELVPILAQLARALSKVHECGIIHRDIKPSNIFLCDAGGGEVFVKLLDFGIAKSAAGEDVGAPLGAATNTGALVGTPYYMSPEQLSGSKGVDHRSDLWSVGVVTFEALTGGKPFNATSLATLAVQVMRDELPRPTSIDSALPPLVDEWFAKACARNPQDRFTNVREMVEAFASCFGEIAPGVMSAQRVVSLAPKARTEDGALGSSVSPNATTLHDTSRSGIATSPGQNAPGSGSTVRLIGGGVAVFAIGAALAFAFIKLSGSSAASTQGLASSSTASAPVLPVSDSVPLTAASQPVVSPLAAAEASAAEEGAAKDAQSAVPVSQHTTAVPHRTAAPLAPIAPTTAAAAPASATATATAKKPPAVSPGNEDDIK